MVKKIFYLLVVLAITTACNNQQQTTEDVVSDVVTELTVANFEDMASEFVGQKIMIAGMVNHTCKHGGKRMFIVDEDTEASVKIEAGDNIDSFDAELEGSDVVVTGIVAELRVDDAYLDEWEKEIESEAGEELKIHDGEHGGEHGHGEGEHGEEGEEQGSGEEGETEEDHHGTDLEKIANFRKMLEETEKDHLSFFSIECLSYEVAPPPPPPGDE